MFTKSWFRNPSYSLFDGSGPPLRLKNWSLWSRVPCTLLFLVLLVVSFALGYAIARSETTTSVTTSSAAATSGILSHKTPHVFLYNRTFGEDSPMSDAAWTQLLPSQGGYFSHPVIAPERSTFSVYHYLHCLNGIRTGFWTVFNMAAAGEKVDPQDLPMMISPPHIRHCVDLLRQALICSPDLTVEVKDEEAGGVHGFGETHQCFDWTELEQWTARWESWKDPVSSL